MAPFFRVPTFRSLGLFAVFFLLACSVVLVIQLWQENLSAAEGDYAIYREATGLEAIGTTVTDMPWDTTVYQGTGFTIDGGPTNVTLADAGHYLVLYNIGAETSGGTNRSEAQSFLNLNGTTPAYGWGSCYIRRSGGADECFMAGSAIIFSTTTNRAIRVVTQRTDSNSATVRRRVGDSGFMLLKLDDHWGYLRSREAGGGQTFNTGTFTTVDLDTDDEIDASHFSRSGGDVTLLEKGRYLVTYNVGYRITVTAIRNTATRLTLNGYEVPGTRVTAHLGGANSAQDFSAQWSGIIEATTTSQVLRVEGACDSETCGNTTAVANRVGVTIAKIPETTSILQVYESGGGQGVDGTADPILFDTNLVADNAFTHSTTSNTSRMEVEESGDYLFFGSFYAGRSLASSTAILYPRWQWRTNGSAITAYGTFGQYNQGESGTTGAFTSGNAAGAIFRNLTANDYIELINTDETTGTDADTTFLASRYGASAVKMSTLLTDDVTVYAEGIQSATTSASSTNVYVGGSFRLDANHATETVTAITITENGTVDASSSLQNIRLYYDLDTTAPYNCASESFAGTELRYGATSTRFSSASGTSSFSGSVNISTSTAMCVYVVTDILRSANDGDTINFAISAPTDVTISSGNIDPEVPVALASSTTIWDFNRTQVHYHFRNDDGSETTATEAALEDEPLLSIAKSTPVRLRFEVSNEGRLTSSSTIYQLEYALRSTTCNAVTSWTDVNAAPDAWDMSNSANLTDGSNTTNIATTTGGTTDENTTFLVSNGGQKDTSSQTGGLTLSPTEFVEIEYSVVPTPSATDGGTYCFRLSNAGNPIDTYAVYPEATIAADVTVSALGTQSATIVRSTTDQYMGGTFAITDTASRTVTSIILSESGTINASSSLDNIRLLYDLDTTAPYNCASESYSGSEAQFGVTDTDGFSAADGTTTFSGSLSVASTSAICAYVVLDVTIAATNGETIELAVLSPGDGGVTVSSGTVSPNDDVSIDGTTIISGPEIHQLHYHFRNDDGSESLATSRTQGNEDTPATIVQPGEAIRLRMGLSNEGTATNTNARQYRIEYGERTTTCAAVASWSDVGDVGGAWDMSNSANLTDGADTTNIATTTGGTTDENVTFKTPNGAVKDTSSQTSGIILSPTEFLEIEYSIEATEFANFSTTYCFRVTNAGTEIENYALYPEATIRDDRDFYVQRGFSVITNGNTSVTITAGADYQAPIRPGSAFIRITTTNNTGAGHTSGGGTQNATNVTTYIQNPNNIDTSITFARTGTVNATRLDWEIIEYRGPVGGDNEIVVRQASTLTFGTTAVLATTSAIGSVADDNQVVVFVTGSSNPDAGTTDYSTGQVTSDWDGANNRAEFERGEASGDAVRVSYAVVEFTGENWRIQRAEHTYSLAGTVETVSITPVGSVSRTFLHTQKRVGNLPGQDEFGHEVWLAGVDTINFQIQSGANSPGLQVSVAWVIENTQTSGDIMVVTQDDDTQTGGTEPSEINKDIGTTISAIDNTSIFANSRSSGTGTAYPRPIIGARIVSTTQYAIWVSDTGDTRTYRAEIVEWPTADRALVQNYYRWYANEDDIDPTDPWPLGGSNLGENTAITSSNEPPPPGAVMRMRMTVRVDNGSLSAETRQFVLQYGERSTTCGAITEWYPIGDTASTTALWRGYDNASVVGGTELSGNPPTGGDLNISVSDRAGTYEETNLTAPNPYKIGSGEDGEFDFVVENYNAAEQQAYCFRMVSDDGTPLDEYLFYPTVTTAGFSVTQLLWRWYDDATSTTPAWALAATNTAPTNISFGNGIKLRTTLSEGAGMGEPNAKFKLQFSETSDFSGDIFDVVNQDECDAGSRFCYFDGAGTEGATITAKVLADADSCSGGVGAGCGSHNEYSYAPTVFGEVGTTSTDFSGTTVTLSRTYQNPVFIVEAISGDQTGSASDRPAIAAITATTSSSFTVRIMEPDEESDDHGNETVAYMVMEAGAHMLPDGTRIDAGRKNITTYYGNAVTGGGDDTCTFTQTFTHTPVVLAALQSNRNTGSPDFLNASAHAVTSSNFACTVEVPDGVVDEPTQSETMGWIAIERGIFSNNGIQFEVATTSQSVTGFTSTPWNEITFTADLSAAPAVMANKQTRDGAEGGWVRYGAIRATSTSFAIDERDNGERLHTAERVGYVAFSAEGQLLKAGSGTHYFPPLADAEYEFTIVGKDPHPNTTYFFRVYDVENATPVAATTTYPSLTTEGSSVTFSVSGVAAGVSTEGVVTDATTTAGQITFGSLSVGVPTNVAHRLTVTTNAPSGYQLYTFERQDLSAGGATINDVWGTNEAPLSWNAGCSATSTGCFGYHSGDNTLSDGSTRFLINDTFSALTGTLAEIAYNSGPVDNEVIDLIYRISVTENQPGGNYEADLVYIAVPSF